MYRCQHKIRNVSLACSALVCLPNGRRFTGDKDYTFTLHPFVQEVLSCVGILQLLYLVTQKQRLRKEGEKENGCGCGWKGGHKTASAPNQRKNRFRRLRLLPSLPTDESRTTKGENRMLKWGRQQLHTRVCQVRWGIWHLTSAQTCQINIMILLYTHKKMQWSRKTRILLHFQLSAF